MEHYKSTFATTAIAAFGLVAAAHILHPGNFERTTYPVRRAVEAAPAAAWVNPPAPVIVTQAESTPVAWTSTIEPAGAPVAADSSSPPAHPRKAAAGHHRKVAKRQTREREASLHRAAEVAPTTTAAEAPTHRDDPIGYLIRSLGFGNDS